MDSQFGTEVLGLETRWDKGWTSLLDISYEMVVNTQVISKSSFTWVKYLLPFVFLSTDSGVSIIRCVSPDLTTGSR